MGGRFHYQKSKEFIYQLRVIYVDQQTYFEGRRRMEGFNLYVTIDVPETMCGVLGIDGPRSSKRRRRIDNREKDRGEELARRQHIRFNSEEC